MNHVIFDGIFFELRTHRARLRDGARLAVRFALMLFRALVALAGLILAVSAVLTYGFLHEVWGPATFGAVLVLIGATGVRV